VVWVKPDRLTSRTAPTLREHIVDDFGVTYRYLLENFELKVDGLDVQPVDPLFLDLKGRFYVPPVTDGVDKGGAQQILDLSVPVKYREDAETGSRHLTRISGPDDLQDGPLLQQGVIHLRVARLPLGFAAAKGKKGDAEIEPMDDQSTHRFEIRKPRRSFAELV